MVPIHPPIRVLFLNELELVFELVFELVLVFKTLICVLIGTLKELDINDRVNTAKKILVVEFMIILFGSVFKEKK